MLSIKRQFYEKDLTQSSLHITGKVSAATPTLEIKQKWSVIDCETQQNDNMDNNSHKVGYFSTLINSKSNKEAESNKKMIKEEASCHNMCKQKSKDKILGLRSLPDIKANRRHDIMHSKSHHANQAFKMCTCMRTNPSTTCSHFCSGSTTTQCISHSNTVNNRHHCTRTESSSYTLLPAWYVSYPPYLVVMPTETPYKNSYYHPNILDDSKLPKKHKHKKTTKRYKTNDLYYDSKWSIEEYADRNSYLENDESVESSEEIEKVLEESSAEIGEQDSFSGNIMKLDDGYIKIVEKDLVRDVVKSLKKHYSHIGIKDCFCSSISINLQVSYIFVLLTCIITYLI